MSVDRNEPLRALQLNHILNLTTNQRRDHTPQLFAWSKLPYAYDKDATCPKFLAALKMIFDDPDEIALLQEIFGTTIIGGNDRRVIWLFQGSTHGGKGVLVGVLCALLGKHNYASIRAKNFGGQFALWAARNKLLIVVPDINGKKPLPAAFVEAAKVISGGDTIDIDGKNKQAVHEILPGKILMVTNDLLRMEDESAALFNRFHCLKFIHSFFPVGHKLHEEGRPQNEMLASQASWRVQTPYMRQHMAHWEQILLLKTAAMHCARSGMRSLARQSPSNYLAELSAVSGIMRSLVFELVRLGLGMQGRRFWVCAK